MNTIIRIHNIGNCSRYSNIIYGIYYIDKYVQKYLSILLLFTGNIILNNYIESRLQKNKK